MKLMRETVRDKRYFYAMNINMHYSFDSLAKLAEKMLGAELDVGDIIICDNKNRDKRKVLQKTKFGYIIHYGRLHNKVEFASLAEANGQIKAVSQPLF